MTDENVLAVLIDIRNWIRASSFASVKSLLEEALPDAKSRSAYQMTDGQTTREKIRSSCKMSPNSLLALQAQCVARGIMEISVDGRRRRLFDLRDFGLITAEK